MIRRDLYKFRDYNGEAVAQAYAFTVQDKYIKIKKDPLHEYLRTILIKGVPKALFSDPSVGSVSATKEYIATDQEHNRIYKENKPDIEAKDWPVQHYPNCTHLFSQICLESAGFVDKTFESKEPILKAGKWQHKQVQAYYLYTGMAEAVEVPVWKEEERKTGFIDLLLMLGNTLWILDYKPEASSAKNKYAVGQLTDYRLYLIYRMLRIIEAKKTKYQGYTFPEIRCAYFDERDTYILT